MAEQEQKLLQYEVNADAGGQPVTMWTRWLEKDGKVYAWESFDGENWGERIEMPYTKLPFVKVNLWKEPAEDYPGQGYFHRHNPRIKRAEEEWKEAA